MRINNAALFKKINSLPPNLQEEVLKYINYLLFSQREEIVKTKEKKRLRQVSVPLISSCPLILMRL